MEIGLTSDLMEQIRAEAMAAHPAECCGLLLGELGRILSAQPARNVHPTPESHFEIDPQALVDAYRAARGGGPQVLGYYHSHPIGDPEPSKTDRSMAAGDGRIWAIVAGSSMKFWRDNPDGFVPLSVEIIEA